MVRNIGALVGTRRITPQNHMNLGILLTNCQNFVMEKLQFETLKFHFAGMGTLEIMPENLELKFVFEVLGNLESQPRKNGFHLKTSI